jgi:hypothetical protein
MVVLDYGCVYRESQSLSQIIYFINKGTLTIPVKGLSHLLSNAYESLIFIR